MEQLRERLLEYGSQTLLTEELLAIILRTGAPHEKGLEWARQLLSKYGGLGGLLHIECRELTQEHGLSETRIALLKAVLELGRRLNYSGSFCQDKKSVCVKIQNPPSLLAKNWEGQVRFMPL